MWQILFREICYVAITPEWTFSLLFGKHGYLFITMNFCCHLCWKLIPKLESILN